MLGFRSNASGQITGELIAWHASQDSGDPHEGYLDYGYSLARTLRLLTPAQLSRVFGKDTTVKVPETLNQLLEMGSVNFMGGSSALSPVSMRELDKAANFLALNTDSKIQIEGHAWYDNDRAQSLSEERAAASMRYLVSMGIAADRITTIGYGATRPLVESADRDQTTLNRRIEIRVQ